MSGNLFIKQDTMQLKTIGRLLTNVEQWHTIYSKAVPPEVKSTTGTKVSGWYLSMGFKKVCIMEFQ